MNVRLGWENEQKNAEICNKKDLFSLDGTSEALFTKRIKG